jgi:hypothetical protein
MGPAPHGEGSRVRASAGPSAAAYSPPTEFPPMKKVRRTSRNDRANRRQGSEDPTDTDARPLHPSTYVNSFDILG